MRYKHMTIGAALLFTISCGPSATQPTQDPPTKDSVRNAGKGDLQDACQEYGWYEDDECDTFCARPDPACGVTPTASCSGEHTAFLARPMGEDPALGDFAWVYDYRPPADADQPTIIYLPGGPGIGAIGTPMPYIPESFGLIRTDLRGIGCNEIEDVPNPSEFYDTEVFAQDIIAMIEHLGLDDYILFGHSYGTVLATVTAHRLEMQGVTPPRAILLEGVLGRGFNDDFPGKGYVSVWETLRPFLPEDVLEVLGQDRPLGLSPKDWGGFFMATMPAGNGPQGHPTLTTLGLLSDAAVEATGRSKEENTAIVKEFVESLRGQPVSAAGLTLQKNVACREVTGQIPADNLDVVLEGGDVRPAPDVGTLCEGIEYERPFDVAEYLYETPTYYFLGQLDPNTPLDMGEYHWANLTTAPRFKVVVKGGGHSPLHGNLAQGERACATEIFKAIAQNGPVEVGDALQMCERTVEVEQAP